MISYKEEFVDLREKRTYMIRTENYAVQVQSGQSEWLVIISRNIQTHLADNRLHSRSVRPQPEVSLSLSAVRSSLPNSLNRPLCCSSFAISNSLENYRKI